MYFKRVVSILVASKLKWARSRLQYFHALIVFFFLVLLFFKNISDFNHLRIRVKIKPSSVRMLCSGQFAADPKRHVRL